MVKFWWERDDFCDCMAFPVSNHRCICADCQGLTVVCDECHRCQHDVKRAIKKIANEDKAFKSYFAIKFEV